MEKKRSCTTTIRMPVETRERLETLAKKADMSLNQYINHCITQQIRDRHGSRSKSTTQTQTTP